MKPSRLLGSVSLPLLGLDWAPIPEGSGQAEPEPGTMKLMEDASWLQGRSATRKGSEKSLKEEERG